ncbi:MAG TPA: G-D-S-L family lipolytic protein, partial [Bacteroidota bacterium]|nr:G-D-S-L family lipolytic protein [Bacteroidota bacterium]
GSPRVVILLPPPVAGVQGESDSTLAGRVLPLLREIAWLTACEVVDSYSLFRDHAGYFSDRGRASPRAQEVIARRLAGLLRMEEVPGFNIISRTGIRGELGNFFGYECTKFTFREREARIVRPKRPAPGCPWIWRARFWGHEPQTEIALLERGFHVVYCDASELFGNDEAVALWDSFYVMLRGAGLAPKAALEGLSRGGVYIYRWAVHAPDRVACVYADAPVLDFRSWPGGRGKGGGNPEEWERFKKDFALGSEAAALAFRGNPIDLAGEIARGGYPMLHVCGLADVVVPFEENTEPFARSIVRYGGTISVITKPGIGHHPHSLPNPAPIVRFILRATGQPLDE